MTRCTRTLAAPLAVLTGALLALGTGGAAAAPARALQAVVSYAGAPVAVPGVQVVRDLPTVHAAVVRADRAALARLAATPGVRGVAPDDAVTLTGRPDDGDGVLASTGLAAPAGRPGAGRGVRVAVVDTGVTDTAALARGGRGRLVDGVDTSDLPTVRTSGRFTDGYGHGTFMADLVAGDAVPGSRGRAVGVAPGATVVVVKVAGADGATSLGRVVAGLDWVADHPDQVDVANLSFAHTRPGDAYGSDPLVDAVARVRATGTAVVVAAGNDAGTVGDPGFDPRGLAVGAADLATGAVAPFSGSAVVAGVRRPDVVASGVGVLGVLPPDSVIGRSVAPRPDGLVRGSGTSQATALTSGVAALLLAEHPGATPAQVKASLRAAAQDLPGERDGAGLLRVPDRLRGGPDGTDPGPHPGTGGGDLTGEDGFDAGSWGAGSWGAGSWGAGSWGAGSWGAGSWGAGSWGSAGWGSSGRAS